jgi:hypothetical protein
MGIWKQVTSQVGGILKQSAKTVGQEPLELGQTVVSQVTGGDIGTRENSAQGQTQAIPLAPTNPGDGGGFKTEGDYDRYTELTDRKNEIELRKLRSELHGEWGVETSVEGGMQKARVEFVQKEEERNKVEEQKIEEKKWVAEQKKQQESVAVMAAKAQASGEKQAWGAG